MNRKKTSFSPGNHSWRDYQRRLKQQSELRRTLQRIPLYTGIAIGAAFVIWTLFSVLEIWVINDSIRSEKTIILPAGKIKKSDIKSIIPPRYIANNTNPIIELDFRGKKYIVETSIDPSLQKAIIESLDTRYSATIGIIALLPESGRVIAWVSHRKKKEKGKDPCLSANIPAASIFKIITAAAAIETKGFNAETTVRFNGGKYTLYKPQLTDRINRYTTKTTFKRAFAESINPVFGKIGQNLLGKQVLQRYASIFKFNRDIMFEYDVDHSRFSINNNPYNWAEIACGFNNNTTISPLHGALIASVIINSGQWTEPSIIDRIIEENRVIYRRKKTEKKQIISQKTASEISKLMQCTVRYGTAHKAFSDKKKNKILSPLFIGGKTGSINNNPEKIKYDWFVGFAVDRNSGKKLAAGIVVAHKDYIGKRAASYFHDMVEEYFKN